jgi:anthranilate synthase component 1
MALAEQRNTPGKGLVEAFILGWEVGAKIGGEISMPIMERGWMNTHGLSIIDLVKGERVVTVLLDHLNEGGADPFDVYRALRVVNPSPYMYYLRLGDLKIVGSSPEMLVKVNGEEVEYRPIAGTRPRGKDPTEDQELERELLADEKERAEHVMLVDLGGMTWAGSAALERSSARTKS